MPVGLMMPQKQIPSTPLTITADPRTPGKGPAGRLKNVGNKVSVPVCTYFRVKGTVAIVS